jgi:DNA excision repair protein ERCC-2
VSKEKKGKIVDSRCRDLTSAFACEQGRANPGSVPLCSFHEVSYFPGTTDQLIVYRS